MGERKPQPGKSSRRPKRKARAVDNDEIARALRNRSIGYAQYLEREHDRLDLRNRGRGA